jgi:hypothetical protein
VDARLAPARAFDHAFLVGASVVEPAEAHEEEPDVLVEDVEDRGDAQAARVRARSLERLERTFEVAELPEAEGHRHRRGRRGPVVADAPVAFDRGSGRVEHRLPLACARRDAREDVEVHRGERHVVLEPLGRRARRDDVEQLHDELATADVNEVRDGLIDGERPGTLGVGRDLHVSKHARQLHDAIDVQRDAGAEDVDARGLQPMGAPGRQERERGGGRAHRLPVLARPAKRLRGVEEHAPRKLARDAELARLVRARVDAGEVAGFEREARAFDEKRERALGSVAPPEMTVEHGGVLAALLEPFGGEAVAEGGVVLGEHRVGGVAHERVTEGELLLAGEARRGAAHDQLLGLELRELALCARRDEVVDGVAPEHLAEDARGPQHAPALGVERLEAALYDRDRGVLRADACALGVGAHELFHEKRLARCAGDDRANGLLVGIREDFSDQALAGFARQRGERDAHGALGERLRQRARRLGPAHREHAERRVREGPERFVHQPHREHVGPLRVVDDEEDGLRRALGREPFEPRGAGLVGHEPRVGAGGDHARALRDARRGDFAEDLGHPRRVFLRHVAADARA